MNRSLPRSMRIGLKFAFRLSTTLFLFASIVMAQKGGGSGGSKGTSAPTTNSSSTALPGYQPTDQQTEFDINRPTLQLPLQRQLKNEQPPCFRWPMNPVLSGTVSAKGMQTPAKALDEFSRACAAVRKKDLKEAQQHLNRAVKLSPRFAAAWTLLGQTQEDLGKDSQAIQSCRQGRDSDSSYLPARLCLTEIAAREEKWDQVLDLTNQVIALRPVRSPSAFYYNALACLQQRQFATAEKSALRALDDADPQQKPEMLWLLAKVYEQKGDRVSEADQLRAYLKLAPHGHESSLARHVLQEIESEAEAKPTSHDSRQ